VVLLSAGGDAASPALQMLLRQKIDWPRLCALADYEQATSVLWAQLSRLGCSTDPGSAALQRLAMVSEFGLRRLQRRLYETCDALAAAGVNAVALKGAAVAHTAYASFVERPMSDIDLLVAPEQAEAAQKILRASRWTQGPSGYPDEAYAGHQHLPPYVDAHGSGARLELHTDLFFEGHPFRFSPGMVHGGARRIRAGRHDLLVPDPLHQLLHACLHFVYGHLMGLAAWRTFRDVAALGASGLIDWTAFIDLARVSGGATSCYWTFRLARATAGVSVPSEVLDALCPPLPGAALRILERHFMLGLLPTDASCPSVRLRNLMWHIGVFPGRHDGRSVRPWGRLRRLGTRSRTPASGTLQRVLPHLRHAASSPRYLWQVLRGVPGI